MHKIVNGQVVVLTAEEAAAIQAEWDAHPPLTEQQLIEAFRASVVRTIDRAEDKHATLLRSLVLIILDEFNSHALKINAILDAIDNATTLANLKTAIAAIPDYPQRNANVIRNAIKSRVTAGDADN